MGEILNNNQWKIFCDFRICFKQKVQEWSGLVPQLSDLQKKAAMQAGTPKLSL